MADYAFTTLDPVLGVAVGKRRFVVADVPGLIEGASTGAGLGLRFLRHLERTRLLIEVVDGSRPDPWRDLEALRAELQAYSDDLAGRAALTVVNKLDLPETARLGQRTRRPGVLFVSALNGEGVPELVAAIEARLEDLPQTRLSAPPRVRLRWRSGCGTTGISPSAPWRRQSPRQRAPPAPECARRCAGRRYFPGPNHKRYNTAAAPRR